MTDDLADPRQWRESIEARVGTLEATVRKEAHLTAGLDSPAGKLPSELRVRRSMPQALLDTQRDGTRRLMRIEDQLINVEGRLTGVEGRLGNVEGELDLVRIRIEAIHGKLDLLLDRS
jgi:hypothetical protein